VITTIGQAKIGLYSIGTKMKVPEIIFHWIIPVQHFRDPIGQSDLRNLDGRDEKVQAFLRGDPRTPTILHAVTMMAEERAKWTAIAFHDYHCRYISTGLVELAATELDKLGFEVAKSHHALHIKE
jgi:hypothetical protein